MKVRIQKRDGREASIRIPASKSLSHRALIAASLADGHSCLQDVVENKDTEATIRALRQLGATITRTATGTYEIDGNPKRDGYHGEVIDCNESGSTLRFLIPLFATTGKPVSFTGHGRLMERPLDVYQQLFEAQGNRFEIHEGILSLQGVIQPGTLTIRGDVSSQFITGLLMSMPLVHGDTHLEILPPYESASYVTLTEDVMHDAGVEVRGEGLHLSVQGDSIYQPFSMRIDGDDSQAAFFLCEACITKTPITVLGVRKDSKQGDHAILSILRSMGATITEVENGVHISCEHLVGTTIDLKDCPDLGPVLFALATQAEGTTTFVNAGRLRIKESDRIACMEEELRKLGAEIHSDPDTVWVTGGIKLHAKEVLFGHNDHRIVMALSVLSAGLEEPVELDGCEAVSKSYPDFFQDLAATGVHWEEL